LALQFSLQHPVLDLFLFPPPSFFKILTKSPKLFSTPNFLCFFFTQTNKILSLSPGLMEVSTEAAVDVFSLPSKIESLESKSLIVADGFSSKSQVEALNDELMEDSHEDPVNSPNSLKTLPELSCGEQCLVSISSNSGGFSQISTSKPQSEETLTISLPSSHIVSPGNQISVPSQSNQDGSGSFLANGNEDGVLLDSGHRLVASCDNDDSEPDSPMQLAREKLASSSSDSKLADGNFEDEEEGFGNDDEKENPRRFFHYDPYYHAMYHNQWGHFDPEFHEYHPGLPPPWIRRFRRQPCPQLWNRWDDREKRRNQEYRLPGFMQETGPTGVVCLRGYYFEFI
jgi:ubiquitin carboxyl-terminal hydrolase 36/42